MTSLAFRTEAAEAEQAPLRHVARGRSELLLGWRLGPAHRKWELTLEDEGVEAHVDAHLQAGDGVHVVLVVGHAQLVPDVLDDAEFVDDVRQRREGQQEEIEGQRDVPIDGRRHAVLISGHGQCAL